MLPGTTRPRPFRTRRGQSVPRLDRRLAPVCRRPQQIRLQHRPRIRWRTPPVPVQPFDGRRYRRIPAGNLPRHLRPGRPIKPDDRPTNRHAELDRLSRLKPDVRMRARQTHRIRPKRVHAGTQHERLSGGMRGTRTLVSATTRQRRTQPNVCCDLLLGTTVTPTVTRGTETTGMRQYRHPAAPLPSGTRPMGAQRSAEPVHPLGDQRRGRCETRAHPHLPA